MVELPEAPAPKPPWDKPKASAQERADMISIIVATASVALEQVSSDGDTGSRGGRYKCEVCSSVCTRKDFLLSEEQAGWCGKLCGVCILHKP